jgi:Peptidase S46
MVFQTKILYDFFSLLPLKPNKALPTGDVMKQMFLRSLVIALALCSSIFVLQIDLSADEGMYPISEIHKLNLKKLGFRIDSKTLYNPNGVSLIDAIVRVGGCTGSFVSPEGLVITNHHCAFGAVSAASSVEHDYITDGFLAKDRTQEIPARGMTIRITESYNDVSREVLGAVDDGMSMAERAKAIREAMRRIAEAAEKANPGKQASVSEMFAGRNYVLFLYAQIKDVRLVYVPPRSIGEFGGEDDNWVWPRHTGDFSFVRAYVAPDGSPAEYSKDNVPYKPRRFLKVNPRGVDDGDFVFILGYPGRTFRHQPSGFLNYDEEVRLKYVADFYDWQIRLMEQLGKDDRAIGLKFESRIKGLANVMKNYRGKLKGLKRLGLVDQKLREEKALQEFIEANPGRKATYGDVLAELNGVYDQMIANAGRELFLDMLNSSPTLLSRASLVYNAVLEREKPDSLRIEAYSDKNFEKTKTALRSSFGNSVESMERPLLIELLRRAGLLKGSMRLAMLDSIVATPGTIARFVDRAYSSSPLKDAEQAVGLMDLSMDQLMANHDPLLALAASLRPVVQELRDTREQRTGLINKYYPLYVDVKEQFQKADFIPDANGTLRLTFGHIKGYSPADAVYMSPLTSLTGVLQKTTGEPPYYNTPERLIEQARARNYGQYKDKKLNDVPVGLLYNTDTTGGNSGSPLMNAKGELVGVNFDRAYEATINDYAWSDSYSRSIAVDIRYVLWVTKYVGGVDYLLKEMAVE